MILVEIDLMITKNNTKKTFFILKIIFLLSFAIHTGSAFSPKFIETTYFLASSLNET
jgi:hypothetical protein